MYLNEYSLNEPESNKNDESSDKMNPNPYYALSVETDEHHALATEVVGKGTEDDTTDHDSTEIRRSDQRCHESTVAYEAPLEKKIKGDKLSKELNKASNLWRAFSPLRRHSIRSLQSGIRIR